ncbi:hypothetical protein FH972_015240 [Carpinus fangiana]|uniref:Uncharacterized protein n=1 Tax=Carpinus fangiana TaxID=176857 RepID=A0A5N6RC74_9ROSI|nr:hypothetical protein FH972_015240 [Carpinus fangiana]
MNFRKTSILLIIFVISVAILSHVRVEAARVLASANQLETNSSVYETAKFTSGPGPGDIH